MITELYLNAAKGCLYPGLKVMDVMQKVVGGYQHPRPPGCNNGMHELLLKCWSFEPNERPTFDTIIEVVEFNWKRENGLVPATAIVDQDGYEYDTPSNGTWISQNNVRARPAADDGSSAQAGDAMIALHVSTAGTATAAIATLETDESVSQVRLNSQLESGYQYAKTVSLQQQHDTQQQQPSRMPLCGANPAFGGDLHEYALASEGGQGYLKVDGAGYHTPPASNPPAAVGAASANNQELQRRQIRTATHSRTTVVEGMFGVVLPGKKASDGKNMYVVCSTTADPGTGLVEIYDTKAAVAKTMPRLTVRLKNVVSVENAVIRQKPHVVVKDSTRVGKPLMITTTNTARLDALLSFLGQPGAGAGAGAGAGVGMGAVGGQLGGPATDYSGMPGAVSTIPQPAMGNGTARNEHKANLGLGGTNEETRL
jgi:hypothetical protein